MFVFSIQVPLAVTMMTEGICWSPWRKSVCLMELLAAIWFLLAGEVASTLNPYVVNALLDAYHEPVAYRDVLNFKAIEIQSGITQLQNEYPTYFFDEYPVYSGRSIKTVVFVWASEKETHAMRNCLYREMKRIGKTYTCMLCTQRLTTFEFCNRTVNASTMRVTNVREVYALSFYVNDTETYRRAEPSFSYINDRPTYTIEPTFSFQMNVCPHAHVGSRVRTFVLNSVEFTWRKTGKLRQRFFSVVGNSPEVMVKSRRNASASVTLNFDVLAINASRIGLLNNSNVELLSLLDLTVACVKYDQFGLNVETNEITHMNTTGEYSQTTKAIITKGKLRLRVNVSIPVVSDHSFGSYVCVTNCKLQTKSNDTIHGCKQQKYFSVVLDDWRTENILYRQQFRYFQKNITNFTETLQTVTNTMVKCCDMLKCARRIIDIGIEKVRETKDWLFEDNMDIVLREILTGAKYAILISTIGWIIIIAIIILYEIFELVRRKLNIRRDAKLSKFMLFEELEIEDSKNRIMEYDVFLSYSSKDRPWVQSTLLQFIESKGFKVCFDERDFPLGCSLPSTIEKSVFESRKTIAVLSPDYMNSRWCVEFEYALMLTKNLNTEVSYGSLLLIKYRDCRMPERMKSYKYLDYTKAYDDYRSVFMKKVSYVFPFLETLDTHEVPDYTQFFDDLLLWLGEPYFANLQA